MKNVLIVATAVFTLLSLYLLWEDPYSTYSYSILFLCGGGLLFFIYQDRIFEFLKEKREAEHASKFCRFNQEGILFPRGYYFKYGFLKGKKLLEYKDVEELRINTLPPTAVVNGNEVIFLVGKNKEACEALAKAYNIKITSPQDNWSLICEPFLDMEYDPAFEAKNLRLLNAAGISGEEVKSIRDKIKVRMLLNTLFTWEWIYYGQYDVLIQLTPLNEKKYWWTMDIALRGLE